MIGPILGELTPLLNMLPGNHHQVEKKEQLLVKVLNYKLIVNLAISALEEGLNFKDGLVGENACQTRSVMFAEWANESNFVPTVTKYITELKDIDQRLQGLNQKHLTKASLSAFLEKHQLQITLPKIFIAAAMAYQLFITKEWEIKFAFNSVENRIDLIANEKTVPTKLLSFKGSQVTKSFVENIDKHSRKLLSLYSIEYVQGIVNQLPLDNEVEELKVLAHAVRDDGNGRSAIPCFAYMDILYRHCINKNIPILLKVSSVDPNTLLPGEFIYLYYEVDGGEFKHREDYQNAPQNLGVVVMESYAMGLVHLDNATLKRELLSHPLKENVLGNDAAHHQYAGDKQDKFRPKNVRCEDYRSIALAKGFCKENPRLCYIDHVYADTLFHQLQLSVKKP